MPSRSATSGSTLSNPTGRYQVEIPLRAAAVGARAGALLRRERSAAPLRGRHSGPEHSPSRAPPTVLPVWTGSGWFMKQRRSRTTVLPRRKCQVVKRLRWSSTYPPPVLLSIQSPYPVRHDRSPPFGRGSRPRDRLSHGCQVRRSRPGPHVRSQRRSHRLVLGTQQRRPARQWQHGLRPAPLSIPGHLPLGRADAAPSGNWGPAKPIKADEAFCERKGFDVTDEAAGAGSSSPHGGQEPALPAQPVAVQLGTDGADDMAGTSAVDILCGFGGPDDHLA